MYKKISALLLQIINGFLLLKIRMNNFHKSNTIVCKNMGYGVTLYYNNVVLQVTFANTVKFVYYYIYFILKIAIAVCSCV